MQIGIIGAGNVGGTLGRLWAKAGHEVMFSSRHPHTLERLAAQVGHGARAGTVEEAATFGEVVLIAVPYQAMPELARRLAPLVTGKVVLDASNVLPSRDGALAKEVEASGGGSGSRTATLLPGARVVKAFNTVHYLTLAAGSGEGARVGVPLAGDDDAALSVTEGLVEDVGAEPVRAGRLGGSERLDFGSAIWNSNLTASELREALGMPAPKAPEGGRDG